MTPKDDVSIEYLREIFDYEPKLGLLLHKKRPHVKIGAVAGHVKSDGSSFPTEEAAHAAYVEAAACLYGEFARV